MAPVMKSDMRSVDFTKRSSAAAGSAAVAFHRSSDSPPKMRAKKRATGGSACAKNDRYVRRQLGSCGCSTAHERFAVRGCAGAVIGAMAVSERGRSDFLFGDRIGEMKGGQFCREISASESTISYVLGHGSVAG